LIRPACRSTLEFLIEDGRSILFDIDWHGADHRPRTPRLPQATPRA
jgi:hypothetical protein